MIQPPPLAYKKWGLQDMDTIVDHSSVGKTLYLIKEQMFLVCFAVESFLFHCLVVIAHAPLGSYSVTSFHCLQIFLSYRYSFFSREAADNTLLLET